jgi:hypothetical protein
MDSHQVLTWALIWTYVDQIGRVNKPANLQIVSIRSEREALTFALAHNVVWSQVNTGKLDLIDSLERWTSLGPTLFFLLPSSRFGYLTPGPQNWNINWTRNQLRTPNWWTLVAPFHPMFERWGTRCNLLLTRQSNASLILHKEVNAATSWFMKNIIYWAKYMPSLIETFLDLPHSFE